MREYFPTRPYDYMRNKLVLGLSDSLPLIRASANHLVFRMRPVRLVKHSTLPSSQRGMKTRCPDREASVHQDGDGCVYEHEDQDADEMEIVPEKVASPSSQTSSSSASSSVGRLH
jgi:hypothetical protein